MEVVCAWCGRKLGEKPPYEDKGVTHGMCQDCYDKERARAKRKRKRIKKQEGKRAKGRFLRDVLE